MDSQNIPSIRRFDEKNVVSVCAIKMQQPPVGNVTTYTKAEEAAQYDPSGYSLHSFVKIRKIDVIGASTAFYFFFLLVALLVLQLAEGLNPGTANDSGAPFLNWIAGIVQYERMKFLSELYFNFTAAVLNPGIVLAIFALIFFFKTEMLNTLLRSKTLSDRTVVLSESTEARREKFELPEDSVVNDSNSQLFRPTLFLAGLLMSQVFFPITFLVLTLLFSHSCYGDYGSISANFLSSAIINFFSLCFVWGTYWAVEKIYFESLSEQLHRDRERKQGQLNRRFSEDFAIAFFRVHPAKSSNERELLQYTRQVQTAQEILRKNNEKC